MPYWGRPVAASHQDTAAGSSRAGFPDFVCYVTPEKLHHGALAEIKPYWTVTNETLQEMFSIDAVQTKNGEFDWNAIDKTDDLYRQVSPYIGWSHCVASLTVSRLYRYGVKCMHINQTMHSSRMAAVLCCSYGLVRHHCASQT